MSEVCKFCKHFGRVAWDDKPGCKEADVRYGTDGYGPWYGGPNCINDRYYSETKNLFEPAGDAERAQMLETIEARDKRISEQDRKIDKLERSVAALARGDS
jgi:hypothetical protein